MTLARGSVPIERTWGETSVFATVDAWEAELEAVLADLPALTAFQGRLGEGASVLASPVDRIEQLV